MSFILVLLIMIDLGGGMSVANDALVLKELGLPRSERVMRISFWGAHAARVLVSAARRNELNP